MSFVWIYLSDANAPKPAVEQQRPCPCELKHFILFILLQLEVVLQQDNAVNIFGGPHRLLVVFRMLLL